jgi:hypothetical protein
MGRSKVCIPVAMPSSDSVAVDRLAGEGHPVGHPGYVEDRQPSCVVYPLSRWVKGPAERLQRPTSNRARELQHAQRAARAAISEPKEHQ